MHIYTYACVSSRLQQGDQTSGLSSDSAFSTVKSSALQKGTTKRSTWMHTNAACPASVPLPSHHSRWLCRWGVDQAALGLLANGVAPAPTRNAGETRADFVYPPRSWKSAKERRTENCLQGFSSCFWYCITPPPLCGMQITVNGIFIPFYVTWLQKLLTETANMLH